MSSLGEEFPKQQARCRELLGQYEQIGVPGIFGSAMLRNLLQRADHAAMSGDVVEMIRVYEEMKAAE